MRRHVFPTALYHTSKDTFSETLTTHRNKVSGYKNRGEWMWAGLLHERHQLRPSSRGEMRWNVTDYIHSSAVNLSFLNILCYFIYSVTFWRRILLCFDTKFGHLQPGLWWQNWVFLFNDPLLQYPLCLWQQKKKWWSVMTFQTMFVLMKTVILWGQNMIFS